MPLRYFDTTYNDPKGKENEAGRAVSGLITVKNQHYKFIITESRGSTEFLIQVISLITIVLAVMLVLIIFLTNRYILNDLWKPFHKTLAQLKSFSPSDNKPLNLDDTKVDEFNELNGTVQVMASKVKNDFQHLKQFTEDASHEMQTPLAVITSKLDTLIQDEALKGEHFDQLHDIYAATSKLSRLNQSLLLLVKIENNLIDDIETLRLDMLIEEKIKQFHELISGKLINVKTDLLPKEITASKYLIDILLNNLFSNAIRHNNNNGEIIINLNSSGLTFQNTGSLNALDPGTLFNRFQKRAKSDGTGLGLAIVKNICSICKWDIEYAYNYPFHILQITFNEAV